jgi:hypothetical protein
LLLSSESYRYRFMILYYRAFNRLFHSPFASSLEAAILFIIMVATNA